MFSVRRKWQSLIEEIQENLHNKSWGVVRGNPPGFGWDSPEWTISHQVAALWLILPAAIPHHCQHFRFHDDEIFYQIQSLEVCEMQWDEIAKFWPILANRSLTKALFAVLLQINCRNNEVVYRKWQIWGMLLPPSRRVFFFHFEATWRLDWWEFPAFCLQNFLHHWRHYDVGRQGKGISDCHS